MNKICVEDNNKNKSVDNNQKDKCPICYEDMGNFDICITKCGHKFCMSCLFKHSEKSINCPLCRERFVDLDRTNNSIEPDVRNDDILDMINQDMSIDVDYMDQLLRTSDLRDLNSTNSNNTGVGIEIVHSENALSSFDLDASTRQVEFCLSMLNDDGCNNSNIHYVDLTVSSQDTEDDNDLNTPSNESQDELSVLDFMRKYSY